MKWEIRLVATLVLSLASIGCDSGKDDEIKRVTEQKRQAEHQLEKMEGEIVNEIRDRLTAIESDYTASITHYAEIERELKIMEEAEAHFYSRVEKAAQQNKEFREGFLTTDLLWNFTDAEDWGSRLVESLVALGKQNDSLKAELKALKADQSDGEQSTLEPEAKMPPAAIQKIAAIKIPEIEVTEVSLSELISLIAHKIRELDPGGISFLTSGFKNQDPEDDGNLNSSETGKKISYSIKDARIDKIFTDLAGHFDVTFHLTSVGVVITPPDGKPFPNAKDKKGTVFFTYQGE